ncbi:SRPBCC family protein [Paenibacillus sp. sptzw28]|uniref:SRPBCC family protein n=1 Tax=Paenibacillus sp. sptzw28 TaxID=715179 RepID=UPI001C6DDE88|nr:SRPBCC family protein [Paenibacillus sp. sptzw28]QYR21364.1 SRPBCC family protein [Paenibacillus sp. sptzw28]
MVQGPEMNNTITEVKGRELRIQRSFHAPRELVWQAWTEPKHLMNWWGPKGFTITIQSIDVKPGGYWRYVMHGADGTNYDNVIRYMEIVCPERIAYTHGDNEDEEQFRVSVTFAGSGTTTELTMQMIFKSDEELEMAVKQYGAIEGAKSTLDRLEEELAILAEGGV